MKASKTPNPMSLSRPVGSFWPYYIGKSESDTKFVVGIVRADNFLHVATVEDVLAAIEKAKESATVDPSEDE